MNGDIDSVWQSFRAKVSDLFVTCYSLPETLHLQAVQDIEKELIDLKDKISLHDRTEATNDDLVGLLQSSEADSLKAVTPKDEDPSTDDSNVENIETDNVVLSPIVIKPESEDIKQISAEEATSDVECISQYRNTRHFAKRRKSVLPRKRKQDDDISDDEYDPSSENKRRKTASKDAKPLAIDAKTTSKNHKSKKEDKAGSNTKCIDSKTTTTTPKSKSKTKTNTKTELSEKTDEVKVPKAKQSPRKNNKKSEELTVKNDGDHLSESKAEQNEKSVSPKKRKTRGAAKNQDNVAEEAKAQSAESDSTSGVKVEKEVLDENSSTEAGKTIYKCDLCFNTYISKSGYTGHMALHKRFSFPCSECKYEGVSKDLLEEHTMIAHICNIPGEGSTQVTKPEKKIFQEIAKGNRKQYKKSSWKAKDEKYHCDRCNKVFVLKQSLEQHLKIHEHGPLKCTDCNKEFYSKNGYVNHVNQAHRQAPADCVCDCGYVAGSRGALKAHKKQVHVRTKTHLCDICGQAFVRKHEMVRHRKATHLRSESDQYQCELCGFTSIFPSAVRHHMKNVHTESQGYVCNICGITLKYKDTLEAHQRRHLATEKTHACSECSYRGICKKDLQQHIKRLHTVPDVLYTCGVCRKTFRDRAKLRRHETIHTGEKAYQCQFCAYACNVISNLRKHVQGVHGQDTPRVRPAIDKLHLDNNAPPPQSIIKEELAIEESVEFVPQEIDSAGLDSAGLDSAGLDESAFMADVVEEAVITDETAMAVENVNLVFVSEDGDLMAPEAVQATAQMLETGAGEVVVGDQYYVLETE